MKIICLKYDIEFNERKLIKMSWMYTLKSSKLHIYHRNGNHDFTFEANLVWISLKSLDHDGLVTVK